MKNNKFSIIYYINLGVPTIHFSIEMMKHYIDCGVVHFQLDLPSKKPDPTIENDFILERMKQALNHCNDYFVYLEAIKQVKHEYPFIDIEMTVYENTVVEIGVSAFVDFCKETNIQRISWILGKDESNPQILDYLREEKLQIIHPIALDLPDECIDQAVVHHDPIILLLETYQEKKSKAESISITQAIHKLRERGIQHPIYGTMGIKTPERVKELKKSGLDGVYVGSALLKLWDNLPELKCKIEEFEKVVEE